MKGLAFSPEAAADISDIWDYTAQHWGADQADAYIDDIQEACFGLTEGRKQGREVDVRLGYLKYAVGRHLVFFRVSDVGVTVIRILHQSMDVARHL